jgi:hypothetical protein
VPGLGRWFGRELADRLELSHHPGGIPPLGQGEGILDPNGEVGWQEARQAGEVVGPRLRIESGQSEQDLRFRRIPVQKVEQRRPGPGAVAPGRLDRGERQSRGEGGGVEGQGTANLRFGFGQCPGPEQHHPEIGIAQRLLGSQSDHPPELGVGLGQLVPLQVQEAQSAGGEQSGGGVRRGPMAPGHRQEADDREEGVAGSSHARFGRRPGNRRAAVVSRM